jgi:hypothetical protein
MEAKGRQLVDRHVGSNSTDGHGLDQQSSHDAEQLVLWSGDVFTLMDERAEFWAMLVPLERDQRIRVEHSFESRSRFARSVSQPRQMLQVLGDVPFVPGEQDWLDAREVLVEGGAADAGLLGDL